MFRTKMMKSLIHWVKDFYHISGNPTIVCLNEIVFIQQLDTAMYITEIRKNIIDQSSTNTKEDSPVLLK